MSSRPSGKRPREDSHISEPPDLDDGEDFIDAPAYEMEKDMPYEDQLKFSGLFGTDKAAPPPPLGHYRLLGKSGLRVSPRLYFIISFSHYLFKVTSLFV